MGDAEQNYELYIKIQQTFQRQYSKKISLLESDISSLKKENELLKERKNFEYEETVIKLQKENLSIIQEYEELISLKMEEIKELKNQIKEEKQKKIEDFDPIETQTTKREISHLKNLLENFQHENKMLKNEIKGLRVREGALILDKESSINLMAQEAKKQMQEASMKLVLSDEKNNLLKKKILKMENMLEKGENFVEMDSKYRKMYLKEKKNYEEILELFEQKNRILKDAIKSKNSLEGVAAKMDTILIKGSLAERKEEQNLMNQFLLGLELYRIDMVQRGALG